MREGIGPNRILKPPLDADMIKRCCILKATKIRRSYKYNGKTNIKAK